MKRKDYKVAFPTALVVVMVAFLATIFFANANLSFAASVKKKSPAVARTSAVEYAESQIKQLQGTLNITAGQQELWNNLVQVMRENAKDMDALNKERAEIDKEMSALDHMKFHRQITEAHLAQMNKLIPPFEAFYTSMSDQQKNITDIVFRTGQYGRSKRK
ncbi:MAG: Spy/CpxP family protein refolding chaperone [Thermodesulfovibrionales bacterium]